VKCVPTWKMHCRVFWELCYAEEVKDSDSLKDCLLLWSKSISIIPQLALYGTRNWMCTMCNWFRMHSWKMFSNIVYMKLVKCKWSLNQGRARISVAILTCGISVGAVQPALHNSHAQLLLILYSWLLTGPKNSPC